MTTEETKELQDVLWTFPQGESEPYGHVPVNRIYEAMQKWGIKQHNQAIDDAIAVLKKFQTINGENDWLIPEMQKLKK